MNPSHKAAPSMPSRTDVGDPSVISQRVAAILDIHQVRAAFERFPPRSNKESLVPVFLPFEVHAQLLNESEVGIRLTFGFMALVETESLEDKIESLFDEHGEISQMGQKLLRFYAEASYVAKYQLENGPPPSNSDLMAFAEINGQLTLTPYWREFLDASLRRAGIPSIMAPVFRSPTSNQISKTNEALATPPPKIRRR